MKIKVFGTSAGGGIPCPILCGAFFDCTWGENVIINKGLTHFHHFIAEASNKGYHVLNDGDEFIF